MIRTEGDFALYLLGRALRYAAIQFFIIYRSYSRFAEGKLVTRALTGSLLTHCKGKRGNLSMKSLRRNYRRAGVTWVVERRLKDGSLK